MGNYIGFKDKDGDWHSERLGTNGSAMAILQLFAVGYSAGKFPNSKRARAAVRTMLGAKEDNPGVKIPYRATSAEDVSLLIGLNGGDCFWVYFDTVQVGTGYFQSTPSCDIYRGILLPILLGAVCDGEVLIPAGDSIRKVAAAWTAVLPFLTQSPAIERLTAMTELANKAAQNGVPLHIG